MLLTISVTTYLSFHSFISHPYQLDFFKNSIFNVFINNLRWRRYLMLLLPPISYKKPVKWIGLRVSEWLVHSHQASISFWRLACLSSAWPLDGHKDICTKTLDLCCHLDICSPDLLVLLFFFPEHCTCLFFQQIRDRTFQIQILSWDLELSLPPNFPLKWLPFSPVLFSIFLS